MSALRLRARFPGAARQPGEAGKSLAKVARGFRPRARGGSRACACVHILDYQREGSGLCGQLQCVCLALQAAQAPPGSPISQAETN